MLIRGKIQNFCLCVLSLNQQLTQPADLILGFCQTTQKQIRTNSFVKRYNIVGKKRADCADASVLFLWWLCCANCLLNSLYGFSNYALNKYEHMNIKHDTLLLFSSIHQYLRISILTFISNKDQSFRSNRSLISGVL